MAVMSLTQQEIFKYLRPDQVHALSDAAEVISLKAGEPVYYRGAKADFFFVVLEGQVALRLPGKAGINVVIDQLTPGAMFGSCISFAIDSYALNAQCTEDSELLKVSASVLKKMMDEEPQMGYGIQSQISKIYFRRYIDTMNKLQAIVLNVPVETP